MKRREKIKPATNQNAVQVTCSIHFDMDELAKKLSPIQLKAFFAGVAQVVAASKDIGAPQ